jgi:tRNA-dihydrouridine synthase 2
MYAQIPQVILNCRAGSVTGVSAGFLACLVIGDIANLVGILLTQGLATQIITAAWYTVLDATCVIQWLYYICVKPPRQPDEGNDPMAGISPLPLLIVAASASRGAGPYEPPLLWGTILGWVSAVLYLGSRVPQLLTNYRRGRTDGLSPGYFISALFGNTTYGASIFLQDHSWPYIWRQFPWLVGSLGNLFFDGALISQFVYYRRKGAKLADAHVRLISEDSISSMREGEFGTLISTE